MTAYIFVSKIREWIDEKIDYIHNNPVADGLVFRAEDYLYSSAIDYAGEIGLLEGIIVVK